MAASTSKAPFELVYDENVIVLLDHKTFATQLSHMEAAGDMAVAVSRQVDASKI